MSSLTPLEKKASPLLQSSNHSSCTSSVRKAQKRNRGRQPPHGGAVCSAHLINELDAVQKHVVLVMLVHHLLVNNVLRLQRRVLWRKGGEARGRLRHFTLTTRCHTLPSNALGPTSSGLNARR